MKKKIFFALLSTVFFFACSFNPEQEKPQGQTSPVRFSIIRSLENHTLESPWTILVKIFFLNEELGSFSCPFETGDTATCSFEANSGDKRLFFIEIVNSSGDILYKGNIGPINLEPNVPYEAAEITLIPQKNIYAKINNQEIKEFSNLFFELSDASGGKIFCKYRLDWNTEKELHVCAIPHDFSGRPGFTLKARDIRGNMILEGLIEENNYDLSQERITIDLSPKKITTTDTNTPAPLPDPNAYPPQITIKILNKETERFVVYDDTPLKHGAVIHIIAEDIDSEIKLINYTLTKDEQEIDRAEVRRGGYLSLAMGIGETGEVQDGTYVLNFTALSKDGGKTEGSKNFVIDHTPPVITVNLEDGEIYTDTQTLTLSSAEENTTIFYSIDGEPDYQQYSTEKTFSEEGDYTLDYYGSDALGNESEKQTISFSIKKPRPKINSSIESKEYSEPQLISLTSEQGTVIKYILDEGAEQEYQAPIPVSAPGNHSLVFFGRNLAGNESEKQSVSFSISIKQSKVMLNVTYSGTKTPAENNKLSAAIFSKDFLNVINLINLNLDNVSRVSVPGNTLTYSGDLPPGDYKLLATLGLDLGKVELWRDFILLGISKSAIGNYPYLVKDFSVKSGEPYEDRVELTDQNLTHTITTEVGENGILTPTNPTVNNGGILNFEISPALNHHAVVTGCNGALNSNGNNYTTGVITSDCTVTANFEIDTYGVTVEVDQNSSINGSVSPVFATVKHGETQNFTIVPNSGFQASVNGCGGTLTGSTFTTGVITGACTITTNFTLVDNPPVFEGLVMAIPSSATSIDIVWNPATDDNTDSNEITYGIFYTQDVAPDLSGTPQGEIIGVQKFTISGLTPQTTYYVNVQAKDSVNAYTGGRVAKVRTPGSSFKLNGIPVIGSLGKVSFSFIDENGCDEFALAFGDTTTDTLFCAGGESSNGPAFVTHQYTSPGQYTVSLDNTLIAGIEDSMLFEYLITSDTSANWSKTKQMGTSFDDGSRSISADSTGNIYLAMNKELDGGVLQAFKDGVTVGTPIEFGATYTISGVAVDNSDDLWVSLNMGSSGEFRKYSGGTLSGDPIQLSMHVTSGIGVDNNKNIFLGYNIFPDGFLQKYFEGSAIGAPKQMQSGNLISAVTTDNAGNVYIVGNKITYDPELFISVSTPFFKKYSGALTEENVSISIGSSASTYFQGVSVDIAGNIYITGFTYGNLDTNVNAGNSDIFVAKFSSSGGKQWTGLFGTIADDMGFGLKVVSENSRDFIYITGNTMGNLDGNINAGQSDVFLMKIDSNGVKQ